MDKKKLSVVVPVYNEEHEVAKVLNKLETALRRLSIEFEIIVVNDASTDKTPDAVSGLPFIVLLNNQKNLGYGASLKRGIEAARYDTICIIDSDNTYPVEEIDNLLEHAGQYDMIVGQRKIIKYLTLDGIKQLGRIFIDFLCSYYSGTVIPDINSGFRLFRKDIALRFKNELCNRFSFTTSLTLLYFFYNYKVKYELINYCLEPTERVTKIRIWKDGFKTGMMIMRLGFRHSFIKAFAITLMLAALIFVLARAVLSI